MSERHTFLKMKEKSDWKGQGSWNNKRYTCESRKRKSSGRDAVLQSITDMLVETERDNRMEKVQCFKAKEYCPIDIIRGRFRRKLSSSTLSPASCISFVFSEWASLIECAVGQNIWASFCPALSYPWVELFGKLSLGVTRHLYQACTLISGLYLSELCDPWVLHIRSLFTMSHWTPIQGRNGQLKERPSSTYPEGCHCLLVK